MVASSRFTPCVVFAALYKRQDHRTTVCGNVGGPQWPTMAARGKRVHRRRSEPEPVANLFLRLRLHLSKV